MVFDQAGINKLLDHLMRILKAQSPKQLASGMGIATCTVSSLRTGKHKFGSRYQIIALTITGWTVPQLCEFMNKE